jgi:hypothetical protein
MLSFVSAARRPLTLALALLVVAKLLHCMWEEAREIEQHFRVVAIQRAGHTAPLEPKRHDCNEAGCICRGATLALAVDVTDFKGLETAKLPIDLGLAPAGCTLALVTAGESGPAAEREFFAPPISGRQLRALYASLTI